jgi:parallel beta-helix repeat protein
MTVPEYVEASTHFVGGSGPGNFTTIQSAIDIAIPGDTVFVFNGTFYESITINRSLSLVGEDMEATVIHGMVVGSAINVTSDWVNITGFTIESPGLSYTALKLINVQNCYVANNKAPDNAYGIFLDRSDNNIIEDNNLSDSENTITLVNSHDNVITNNDVTTPSSGSFSLSGSNNNNISRNKGIRMALYYSQYNTISNNSGHIRLEGSNNNVIIGNSANYTSYPIFLSESSNNIIADNTLLNMAGVGIYVRLSVNNTIFNNTMRGDDILRESGVFIDGNLLEHWNSHTISPSNTIESKPVYYRKNAIGGLIPLGAGQIILANCTGVSIDNQNLSSVYAGIELGFSSGITISRTTFSYDWFGLYLFQSRDNLVTGNNISLNYWGMRGYYSNNNTVEGNVFFSNNHRSIDFEYTANDTIVNNTVSSNGNYAIALVFSTDTTIVNNTVSHNLRGIELGYSHRNLIANNTVDDSIGLTSSDCNRVINNTASSADHGMIGAWSSNSNIISTNTISLVLLWESTRQILTDNTMVGGGIWLWGDLWLHWNTHSIDVSNTVNGKPIYYWKNATGGVVPAGAGQVILANSTGVVVENQNVSNTYVGVELGYSSGNFISNITALSIEEIGLLLFVSNDNTISNITISGSEYGISEYGIWSRRSGRNSIANSTFLYNEYGISLGGSICSIHGNVFLDNWEGLLVNGYDNTVHNNTFMNNWNGIHFYDGERNMAVDNSIYFNAGLGINVESDRGRVYHNTIVGNQDQARDRGSGNEWDNGYPSGGNYWGDYDGVDFLQGPNQDQIGSDGIGDEPYLVQTSIWDRYPLMSPLGIIHMRPPASLGANLSGGASENITITWALSPDDGTGFRSVTGYRIYRNSTFDSEGLGYQLIASTPSGVSTFVDSNAGEGDPNDYFYRLCAVDLGNNTSCSTGQVGKYTRPLSKGPNLVSIPLIQSDEIITTVLQTVSYDKAWFYDPITQEWKSLMKSKPYGGTLKSVSHTIGFWVNVTEDSNLTVAGVVPSSTTINLQSGWNLVGFPSFSTDYTVADLKVAVAVDRIEGFDALASPYFLRVVADGDFLQAGFGYWIRVGSNTSWMIGNS